MTNQYPHLSFNERAELCLGLRQGESLRSIARRIGRSASTLSRELRRNQSLHSYCPEDATFAYRCRRKACKPRNKIEQDSDLKDTIVHMLKEYWSPQQIAGTLKDLFPNDCLAHVSHETIYGWIYAHPRGELKKELISCLRHGRSSRRPRSGGVDRRSQIPDLVSIHLRPPEIETREVPGHWEGDLIKGAFNRSAVGTLVERTSGMVYLAKMDGCTATHAMVAFSDMLNSIPRSLRLSMTYDQGVEMVKHAEITQRTGTAIYFADPHSPWQRGSNENTNGLLRQYLPKGTDLSVYSQEELNKIAFSLNSRPRQRHGFKSPIQVFYDLLQAADDSTIKH